MKLIFWAALGFIGTGALFMWALFHAVNECEAKGGVFLSRDNVCIQKGAVIR